MNDDLTTVDGTGRSVPAVGLVMSAVLAEGVVSLLLAAEAIGPHRESVLHGAAIITMVLVPLVWASAAGSHYIRSQAHARDHSAHQRLSALVGTTADVVWETTLDGVITYAGPQVTKLLGYRPDQVVGRGIDAVMAGDELERGFGLVQRAAETGQGWTNERFAFLDAAGREVHMYGSGVLRRDVRGEPVGLTGSLHEIAMEDEVGEEFERLRAQVDEVIETRAIRPVYQPIIDTAKGRIIGAEALARFSASPQMTPDRWFSQAADVGLGLDLELLAAEIALAGAPALPESIYVSVNLSPTTLASQRLHDLLAATGWPLHRLVIEITEHASVDDYDDLSRSVSALRGLGVRIAVDDAGAGYASFRHILQLRPDYIKFDRALNDGLDHNPAKRALAGAFVAFGQEVGAVIVAEGSRRLRSFARPGRWGCRQPRATTPGGRRRRTTCGARG